MWQSDVSFPDFTPRFPWLNPDLQTLRNFLIDPHPVIRATKDEEKIFETTDGSRDQVTGVIHWPALVDPQQPLIILIHGMAGSIDSIYMKMAASFLLNQGYPVMRLNLRGAGSSAKLCENRYHGGFTQDLQPVIEQIKIAYSFSSLFLVGFSLGGNIVLKWAAAQPDPVVKGFIAVSVPIDLALTERQIGLPRNWPYHRYLLYWLKKEFQEHSLYKSLSLTKRQSIKTIYQFDACITAPMAGFDTVEKYYQQVSAVDDIPTIRVPTLLIQAQDDPWIPFFAFNKVKKGKNPLFISLFPKKGGHLGFHGVGSQVPWYNSCAKIFIEKCLHK